MNKFIVLIAMLCVSVCAIAQDDATVKSSNEVSMKPLSNNFTVEVNFSPLSSNPIYISYLRFRKFTSERSAIRMGASIGIQNDNPTEDLTRKTFELSLKPGYEWHFSGTERLSPYIGVEADISFKNSSLKDSETDYEISGAWSAGGVERGFTRFGANFIIGADFYIAKRIYMGTEIGFGFESTSNSDITVKIDGDEDDEFKGGSSFQLGPNFNSAIRLGFVL